MHAEHTAEIPKLNLPPDLLTEVNRRGATPRNDFQVEGWKPSLIGRLLEKLIGGKERVAKR